MTLFSIIALAAASAILTLLIQRKHFLMALLSLEAMTLITVCLLLTLLGSPSEMDTPLFIVVLSFAAVEASMGLSILVAISRKTGSELIHTLTMSKC